MKPKSTINLSQLACFYPQMEIVYAWLLCCYWMCVCNYAPDRCGLTWMVLFRISWLVEVHEPVILCTPRISELKHSLHRPEKTIDIHVESKCVFVSCAHEWNFCYTNKLPFTVTQPSTFTATSKNGGKVDLLSSTLLHFHIHYKALLLV